MSLGESPTRRGLQILLKANCGFLSWEFDDHDERPRAVLNGVAGRPVVVPIKTIIDVLSDAHVVAPGICITANDVNEPVSRPSHAGATRTVRARSEAANFAELPSFRTQFLPGSAETSEQKQQRFRGCGSPPTLAGETAFACSIARRRLANRDGCLLACLERFSHVCRRLASACRSAGLKAGRYSDVKSALAVAHAERGERRAVVGSPPSLAARATARQPPRGEAFA